jgi:formimidoylglutamate deiminase
MSANASVFSAHPEHVEGLAARRLWSPMAWLGTGTSQAWANNVLLEIDGTGFWSTISADVSREQAQQLGATLTNGPLLPGIVNAHSHAFQRAFAGLAERRDSEHDDFWSWRDRMYRVALAISPVQLKAVAAQLHLELLRGGYTHVCEFHYLHHAPNGAPYADPHAMAWMLIEAASEVGIGLTMLPVLYERSGFTATTLRDDQRRFATDAAWVLDAQQRIAQHAEGRATLNAGVAIHSLRAAGAASIQTLTKAAHGPIHIHVAEQTGEVDECIKVNGLRPVQWLAERCALDRRWQLVHATHVTHSEIDSVAHSGASAVICPATEANLGDGTTDLAAWLNAGATLSIGSDSHVTRDWREELRLVEYGQRLQHRARNISASPAAGLGATAERLFSRVVTGCANACGHSMWGLIEGARADALVVDSTESALLGVPPSRTLDAMIFSSPSAAFADVMVAGRWVIRHGTHAEATPITTAFTDAMRGLWADLR